MHQLSNSRTRQRLFRRPRLVVPRGRRALGALVAGLVLIIAVTAPLALARDPVAPPELGPDTQFLTADEVLDALRGAGLSVQDVTVEPIGGSPSGPPATESEALRFVIEPAAAGGLDHPLTGRVLVFNSADALQVKANWFRRAGVEVVQHRNVLVWLDADLDPQALAGYRRAVAGMR